MAASAASAQRHKPATPIPTPPPIYVPTFTPERYGQWTVDRFGTGFTAYVNNTTGAVFGVFCTTSCVAYLNAATQCDDKADYPALIATPAGAFNVMLTCKVIDKRFILATDLTKGFVDSFEIGGDVGIAFPLEGGQFQVSRFSLIGALKATGRAADLADVGKKQPAPTQTPDSYKL
jgi:hypothetical protein